MPPKKPKYRLEPLLRIKVKMKRQAEINLAKKIKALEEEKEKIKELEKLKESIAAKRNKVNEKMCDNVSSGQALVRESQLHLGYMDKLKSDERSVEIEIDEQNELIDLAQRAVKRARRDYIDAAQEVDVMEKHKELWLKKEAHKLNAAENKMMNELGNTVHQMNRMK